MMMTPKDEIKELLNKGCRPERIRMCLNIKERQFRKILAGELPRFTLEQYCVLNAMRQIVNDVYRKSTEKKDETH